MEIFFPYILNEKEFLILTALRLGLVHE